MTERKFALTRLAEGDYLLPSNDTRTLWRIRSYEENGSATVVDNRGREREIRGKFWSVWKYRDSPTKFQKYVALLAERNPTYEDFLEEFDAFLHNPNEWREWSTMFRTRREAIEDALRDR